MVYMQILFSWNRNEIEKHKIDVEHDMKFSSNKLWKEKKTCKCHDKQWSSDKARIHRIGGPKDKHG